ncbi:MAG TPA: mechanosensitive ion channel family protein [Vicinamibacterales bacterium]|nr:mechanosensitive ion channel family protein [Vicinamibacterales bacterium]
MTQRFFAEGFNWGDGLIAITLTVAAAWILGMLASRVVRAVLVAILGDTLQEAAVTPAIKQPVRFVAWAVFALSAIALILPAFELVGVRTSVGLRLRTVTDWFFLGGLRILLVGFLAYASTRLVAVVVRRFEHEISQGTGLDVLERAKRARTLGDLIQNVITAVVVTIALLMILRELNLDIMPLLTGAGIAGVALGFGAQTLVRDVISGFFLILENQVRVGDVARVNNVGGLVEAINLRTLVLRDYDGTVHIVPAGEIRMLDNLSKDFSYAVVDIPVAYGVDSDRAVDVLKHVGEQLQNDPGFGPHILAPIEVAGIESLGETNVTVRARMKTVPLKQFDVARELRRRIKKTYEERNIQIQFPQREVVIKRGRSQDRPADS